ncbi:MAG TPA: hypothetical protein VIM58_07370 [Candidatus Methylacidiphilales bacterium]
MRPPSLTPGRIVFALALLLFAWSLGRDAAAMPPQVASHFDAEGRADGTMPLRAHLLSFGGLGLGMSFFLIGVCWSIRLFPPSALNLPLPDSDYWRRPENHARACRLIADHSYWIAALNLVWLTLLHRQIAAANLGPVPALPPGGLALDGWIYGGGTALWIAALVLRVRRAAKAPASAS